jgi:hypothetical protein
MIRRLLERLLRPFTFILVILFAPMICACSVEMLLFLASDIDFGSLDWFLVGFVSFALVYGAILYTGGAFQSHLHFIRLLRHELTHSLTTMISGGRVREMLVVNPIEKPGTNSYVDALGLGGLISPFVYLSPYYLPLFTLPFLLLRYLVSPPIQQAIEFLIGFTLAFHYTSLIDELLKQRFGLGQTDIRRTGIMLSYVVIGVLNLLSLVVIKSVLQEKWPTVDNLTQFISRTQEYYKLIIDQVIRLIPGI